MSAFFRLNYKIRYRVTFVFALSIATASRVAPTHQQTRVMDASQQACEAFHLRNLAPIEKRQATEIVLVGSRGIVQLPAQSIDEVRMHERLRGERTAIIDAAAPQRTAARCADCGGKNWISRRAHL